jgi:hypothetical protein
MAKLLQIAINRFQEHMSDREYPACFSEEEFRAWKLHEEELPTLPIRNFTCRDCTVPYQKKMVKENRCCISTVSVLKVADRK